MKRTIENSSSCMVISYSPEEDLDHKQISKRRQLRRRCSDFTSCFPSILPQPAIQYYDPDIYEPTTRNNFFESFPRELFALILFRLPASSICQSFRVCKAWSLQATNEYLWKLLYNRNVEPLQYNPLSWKVLYRRWLEADGLSISLKANKTSVFPGDSISFEISIYNSKSSTVGVTIGHSCFGIAPENGCLFNLNYLSMDSQTVTVYPIQDSTPQRADGEFYYIAPIQPGEYLTFIANAVCTVIQNQKYYVFSSGSQQGYRHALAIPNTEKYNLLVTLQGVVVPTQNCVYYTPNFDGNIVDWKGRQVASNNVEITHLDI